MANLAQRLSKLERDTRQDQLQPTYISVSVEDWERGDLKLDRPVKVYAVSYTHLTLPTILLV